MTDDAGGQPDEPNEPNSDDVDDAGGDDGVGEAGGDDGVGEAGGDDGVGEAGGDDGVAEVGGGDGVDVEDLLPPEGEVDLGGRPDGNGSEDAPLGDLAEEVDRRRDRDAGDDVMDAFEAVEVDEVDEERLWGELSDEELDDAVASPRSDAERDVRVVAKREYCQRCQFFSAPPETRCTHEDGEILELVDVGHFRVADCPILRGEEELEHMR